MTDDGLEPDRKRDPFVYDLVARDTAADVIDRVKAKAALVAASRPGATHTLGPATGGHWCGNCRQHCAEAADVLHISDHGVRRIATFIHCPTCG